MNFFNLFGGNKDYSIMPQYPTSPIRKIVVEKIAKEFEEEHPKMVKVIRGCNKIIDSTEGIPNNPEKVVRKFFAKKVIPVPGAIVYCDICAGQAEHSGVYIGEGLIVELNGKGQIVAVNAEKFTDNILTFDRDIYVSSAEDDNVAIGSSLAAVNAEAMIGAEINYNLILKNCHQFTAGCVLNDFENANNTLDSLKNVVKRKMNYDEPVRWLKWDWKNG